MFKKIIVVLIFISFNSAFADGGMVNLKLRIAGAMQNNAYFLCLYGSGCYSMKAGAKGRTFPIHDHVLANQKKIFVTDIRTRRIYAQPISESCLLQLKNAETVTISGQLSVKGNVPKVENLTCKLTA